MGFLKVLKGKEAAKDDTSPADIGQEAFNFIYDQSPVEGAIPGERYIEIAHFEALAAAVHLNLEDLSLHLLAFIVDPSPKKIFRIPEKHFVAWMTSLAGPFAHSSPPPSRKNNFAPLFAAAHAAVIEFNARLRTHEELRVKFYRFLYDWCLKGNMATDRTDIAKELWSCFFSASPLSFNQNEANLKFTAYVSFRCIDQWLDFISLQAEKVKEVSQGSSVVNQFGVSLDTWTQLIPFAKLENYNEYDEEDSWPVVMDDFVEYAKKLEVSKTA